MDLPRNVYLQDLKRRRFSINKRGRVLPLVNFNAEWLHCNTWGLQQAANRNCSQYCCVDYSLKHGKLEDYSGKWVTRKWVPTAVTFAPGGWLRLHSLYHCSMSGCLNALHCPNLSLLHFIDIMGLLILLDMPICTKFLKNTVHYSPIIMAHIFSVSATCQPLR